MRLRDLFVSGCEASHDPRDMREFRAAAQTPTAPRVPRLTKPATSGSAARSTAPSIVVIAPMTGLKALLHFRSNSLGYVPC
jgi:hypothetical protein